MIFLYLFVCITHAAMWYNVLPVEPEVFVKYILYFNCRMYVW